MSISSTCRVAVKGRETGAVRSNHLNSFSDLIAGSVDPGGVYVVASRRSFWLSHHTAFLLVSYVLNWADLTILEKGDGIAGKFVLGGNGTGRGRCPCQSLLVELSVGSIRKGGPSRDSIECDGKSLGSKTKSNMTWSDVGFASWGCIRNRDSS